MHAIISRRARLGIACALILSGCSDSHPGPSLSGEDDVSASPPTTTTAAALPSRTINSPPGGDMQYASFGSTSLNPTNKTSSTKQNTAKPVLSIPPVASSSKLKVAPAAAVATSPVVSPPTVAGPRNMDQGTDAVSSFDNVEVVDAGLQGQLAVERVGSEPSANSLLSVFVGLKNKTARRLDLEVQTVYKDKDGAALNAGSWVPMTLKPHEETEYRSASITAAATDFFVRIRRGKE